MPICQIDGCAEHYGCRLRAKGVGISPAAMPSRHNRKAPRPPDPAWERGVAGERRPDGSFMPFLNEHREPIRLHEQANRRHELEQQVDRLKRDPLVFKETKP